MKYDIYFEKAKQAGIEELELSIEKSFIKFILEMGN